MGPLTLHIVLLVVIDLSGIESVVFRQSMITNRRKKPKQSQDSFDKRLDEECEVDEQCQLYTNFAACISSGDVSVCTCVPGFARKIDQRSKCVVATIEVAGNMLLTDIPWEDDMLVEGTEAFNSTTSIVEDLLMQLDEIIEITDIYIVKNGSSPEIHYVVLIYNDEAEPPAELKRWMVTTKQERVDHLLERRQLPETIEDNIIYKINEMAYFLGIDVHVISTHMITGKLGSVCIEDSDCTTPWSSCVDSACSCTQGPVKTLGDEPYCS